MNLELEEGRMKHGFLIVVCIVAAAVVVGGTQAADREQNPQKLTGGDSGSRAVNSWTIYDDGDMTADTLVFPPGVATSGWQDHYFLVEGGVVSASTVPFSIEQIQYYLENIYTTWASMGIWTAGNLNTYYEGGNPGGVAGWNTYTLSTPLQITATGFPQWWMGAVNSYTVGSPVSCTSCRQVGVDTVGIAAPGRGYYSDIDLLGFSAISPVPLASNQIPIIRAGITANSSSVPVELVEFSVE
jgi:hypothetical protein